MKSGLPHIAALAVLTAGTLPAGAAAQSLAYSDASDGDDMPVSEGSGDIGKASRDGRGTSRYVSPYIEAAQVVTAEISPGDDVLTYSRLAAGVDASIAGRNNAGSVSLRYERMIGWSDEAPDGNILSGVARGYATVTRGVQIEAGGLAARTRVENTGSAVLGPFGDDDTITQVYSVYAGPSIATRAGDVAINANYRVGYTKVEQPDAFRTAPGQPAVDVFDDSVVHVANVTAGVKPYEVLPVGVATGASYYREDVSNLDQRVEDFHARVDVTVPVTHNAALVGGVGYEKVEISSRDAVRDADGVPVVGPGGRFVTDENSPRILAYDVDGLTWDAGVIWRPSSRTALEAHVARRYGSTSVYGSFAYAPTARSSINISVYDNVAGFGGQVNRALVDLPEEFTAVRNPLTGDLSGCVSSLEEGTCLSGALGSVRSATFRARGVAASYALDLGRIQAGIGAGYDRRKFIAAPGTVLAVANGVIDENYWLAAYLNGEINARSGFTTTIYANWFDTRSALGEDGMAMGAVASYYRYLTSNLSAAAALGIDGFNRNDPLEDDWRASAQVGVRYSF